MQMQPNDSLIPKDQDIIVRVQRPTYAFATSQVARCGLQLASAEIAERAGPAARCHGATDPVLPRLCATGQVRAGLFKFSRHCSWFTICTPMLSRTVAELLRSSGKILDGSHAKDATAAGCVWRVEACEEEG